jgi:hypothetical protein
VGRRKKQEEPMTLATTYVEPDMKALKEDAQKWALECGLRAPLRANEPIREQFPKHGHGYSIVLNEVRGKERMATARYTHDGKRNFWTIEGVPAG